MIARFAVFSLFWITTAFLAPPEWRVVALAITGSIGAWTLRSLWLGDLQTLNRGRDWLIGAAAGLFLAMATGPAYELVATFVPALRPEVMRLYGQLALAGRPLVLVPFFAVILLEELLWRGAAFRLVGPRAPWIVAVVATTLYALAQSGLVAPIVVLVALVCGGVWSALRAATGGLAASLACHAVWDLAIFVLFPLEAAR